VCLCRGLYLLVFIYTYVRSLLFFLCWWKWSNKSYTHTSVECELEFGIRHPKSTHTHIWYIMYVSVHKALFFKLMISVRWPVESYNCTDSVYRELLGIYSVPLGITPVVSWWYYSFTQCTERRDEHLWSDGYQVYTLDIHTEYKKEAFGWIKYKLNLQFMYIYCTYVYMYCICIVVYVRCVISTDQYWSVSVMMRGQFTDVPVVRWMDVTRHLFIKLDSLSLWRGICVKLHSDEGCWAGESWKGESHHGISHFPSIFFIEILQGVTCNTHNKPSQQIWTESVIHLGRVSLKMQMIGDSE